MPVGGARPGAGRPKGSKNIRTIEVEAKLKALGCDPIEGMALIALDPATEIDLKAKMFAELAQYVAPKRKAMEVEANVSVRHEDALEAVAAALNEHDQRS